MSESILDSVKKVLGIPNDYDVFDTDIIMHINSILSVLHQLGASPEGGVYITDSSTKWSELIGDRKNIEMVRSYVALRVRLLFDPPTTSHMETALKAQAEEFEWRLNIMEDLFKPVHVVGGVNNQNGS